MRQFARTALVVSGLTFAVAASQAKPEYAKKEMKLCAYCHVNPQGGGPRNPKGAFYAAHDHTFKGLPPEYKSLWKMDITPAAERVALGDLTGDKTARLVLVTKDGKASVNKVSDKLTEEGTVDLGKDWTKVAVGKYAKGKPAVIVVPGAVYYKDGDKYAKKDAKDISDITGYARFTDGEESVFYYSGAGIPESWAVDLGAEKVVTAGHDFVDPGQGGGVYSELTIHPPVDLLQGLHIPEEGQKTLVMGLFDPRNEGKLYQWITWAPKEGGTYLTVAEFSGGNEEIKPIWKSSKLSGKILDVALGTDPKGSKNSGFLVLTQEGDKRTVEFFALD